MSEDEIIKRINYVIDKWYDENLEIDCRWIEGLLDLYNKQKEKNKQEYNKGYFQGRRDERDETDSKIKAKIKELKKQEKETDGIVMYTGEKKVLYELLGDIND